MASAYTIDFFWSELFILQAICFTIYFLVTLKRREKFIDSKLIINFFLIFYIIGVVNFVLTPIEIWSNDFREYIQMDPFTLAQIANFDLVPIQNIVVTAMHVPSNAIRIIGGNVALLFPLPFFLALLGKKPFTWKRVIRTGFLVSFAIETTQLVVNFLTQFPNRVVSVNDLILNTLGVALGYFVFQQFHWVFDAIIDYIDKVILQKQAAKSTNL